MKNKWLKKIVKTSITYLAGALAIAFSGLALADVDLVLEGTATTPTAIADTVTYEYTITNIGSDEDATNVIFTTSLPSSISFLLVASGSASCSAGDPIVCITNILEKNDSFSITIVGSINEFGSVSNIALVVSDQNDINQDDNSVEVTVSLEDTRLESNGSGAVSIYLISLLLFVVFIRARSLRGRNWNLR